MTANWTNTETGKTMTVYVHGVTDGWARVNKGETKTGYIFKVKAERLA